MFGAPPLGCLPFVRTLFGGLERVCTEEINMASKLFNSKLSSELHNLNQSLPQAKVVYIRIYDSLLNIIQNPINYGTNLFLPSLSQKKYYIVKLGICGNPDSSDHQTNRSKTYSGSGVLARFKPFTKMKMTLVFQLILITVDEME